MRLSPECVRLRRMAKAHAAGEISESEYREARRAVIDRFGLTGEAVEDDDTRPRWGDEQTLRSQSPLAGRSGVMLESTADADSAPRRWLWLAALALVLVAALLGLPQALAADAAGFDVPPVRERSPDPASSPRLAVGEVQVLWGDAGSMEVPAVSLEALQSRADQSLARVRARNLPGSHGFSPSELDEVARFLSVLEVHDPDTVLDAADARDLSALIRDQKARRGVSVAQLEEVARDVQVALREQGLFLGVAYLPAQRLDGGVAQIRVLPGRLGDIVVEGGHPGPVTGTFSPLLGQPVTLTQISSRLQALNALPGFSAQASFGPGDAVGETRLRLDVLEQRSWSAGVTLDNHGDDATGDQRIGVSGAWLNPRGVGDRLSAGALLTVDPDNQRYGYLDYDMPLAGAYRVSARLGNNDFSGDGLRPLDGDGLFADVLVRRNLSYARERALTLIFGASRHALDWDDGISQRVTMANVGLAGHRVWDASAVAADAAANLTLGHIGGDRFVGQDDAFWLLEIDGQAWMPLSLPLLDGEQKLSLRLAGQWSDSLLPATRRFALGGAERARAFDRSAFLGDRGVLAGVELRVPLGLGELLLFAESGYGDGRAEDEHAWALVTDLGLGWSADLAPGLSTRLSWAQPLAARGSGGFDDDGSRWYWSLRYAH
ncbi:MAG: ShlB/FhaC/HecB family hemolysin secretion/activation protein [Pseudomonadales bacterium]